MNYPRRIILLLTTIIALSIIVPAQEVAVSTISGFIKFDAFRDTRQVTAAREGHLLLYPKAENPDVNGDDLNAVSNLNMVSFQTRARIGIKAPEALGAAVSGLVEADFFGASGGNENELRLRHAILKLDWGATQLLFGQYWSPLFTTAVYPQVVSFNTGMPIQPFARNPQIRLTRKLGKSLVVYGAATMQRDAFEEIGGRSQQQMAGIPGLHAHGEFSMGKTLVGAGGHLRTVRPTATADLMSSIVLTGYAKTALPGLSVRGKFLYGGDMADQLMLGGYAAVTDTVSGDMRYEPLQTLSAWGDVMTTGKALSLGVFAGYSTNLGMNSDLETGETYRFAARSANLTGLWRVSPRAVYNAGKVRLAAELEITSALYASDYETNLAPKEVGNDERVTNIRALFAAYLFF